MHSLIHLRTLISLGLLLLISSSCMQAQQSASLRIGIYDSRALAIAYYQSPPGQKWFQELKSESATAKAANDAQKLKELEAAAIAMQELMHEQGFSTGSVSNIINVIKDKLPGIAKQAGVPLLVSKWDVVYHDPSIEYIDVTLPLVRLLAPEEKALKLIENLKNHDPVPIETLPRLVSK